MNILLLTASWYPPVAGGVKANARILVAELATQHAVTVFLANWDQRSSTEATDENGVRVIQRRVRAPVGTSRPVRAFFGWLLDLPAFLREFRRICRERQIDVIHIQQGGAGWFDVALATFIGIPPYTVGLHGGEVRGYQEGGFLLRRCFDFLLWRASAVMAVSSELAGRAKAVLPAATQIVVIPNGVRETMVDDEEDAASISNLGVALPKLFFLSVGSLLLVKGHDVAIHAWRYVLETHPDCHLVIVGDGERRLALERQIKECECEGRVHLLGVRTPATIRRLMASACGLVHPSRYESLGIVLLEAGTAGCPVVATSVGGIPHVIEHEKCGLLVPPENDRALAAAILRILEDRAFAGRVAANLQARVRREFTASAMAEKYASVFESVANRSRRPKLGWQSVS